MLIKVTTRCSMGCSHCMEDAQPDGQDMTEATFDKAVQFAFRVEGLSWQTLGFRLMLLGGGEPTDHPLIGQFVQKLFDQGCVPLILSNGLFLSDEAKRNAMFNTGAVFQITNDPRFYPQQPDPDVLKDVLTKMPKGVQFEPALSVMFPMGRFKGQTHPEVPTRKAPTCFNLRSATRAHRDVRKALAVLRVQGQSSMGLCCPAVSADGTVTAGECRFCSIIGNVDSTAEEITEALDKLRCDRCGLKDKLTQEQKRAIGESFLFGPHELFR